MADAHLAAASRMCLVTRGFLSFAWYLVVSYMNAIGVSQRSKYMLEMSTRKMCSVQTASIYGRTLCAMAFARNCTIKGLNAGAGN